MKLPPDFRDLLEEFASGGVEYLVVGGYAFAFHARSRATKDVADASILERIVEKKS